MRMLSFPFWPGISMPRHLVDLGHMMRRWAPWQSREQRMHYHRLAAPVVYKVMSSINVEQRTAGRSIEDFKQFGNLSEMSKVAAEFRDFEQPLFG